MFGGALGLTEVSTRDLERALRALYRGDLEIPVHIAGFARVGLQHCSQPLSSQLRSLDEAGIRAVLVRVLAERKKVSMLD